MGAALVVVDRAEALRGLLWAVSEGDPYAPEASALLDALDAVATLEVDA
jgi:hypothetical protein